MRDQRSNPGASADSARHRTCDRCGQSKPPSDFSDDKATVCRRCRRLARFSRACRRAAIAHLIAAHQQEYEALLRQEQAKQGQPPTERGGGPHVA
jgi:recombinational DNA repair protein (RecF pathway)